MLFAVLLNVIPENGLFCMILPCYVAFFSMWQVFRGMEIFHCLT